MTEAEKELVSIITPMYNAEKYVTDTIQSVLSQTYENWEMIIVNDGSTDSSPDIAERYAKDDTRIKIVNQPRNMGIASARNKGIEKAKGNYVAFVDSDDMWKKDKLEKQVKFMCENGYPFTYTACELIEENGTPLNKTLKVRSSADYKELLKSNCIVCSSVVIDRRKIKAAFADLKHEDYAAWLSILKNGVRAYLVKDMLTRYRLRKTSVSANKFKSISWVFTIYRKHLKMPVFEAIYRIIVYFFYGLAKYLDTLEVVFRKK